MNQVSAIVFYNHIDGKQSHYLTRPRAVYVSSVGANSNLLLGIMPDNTGSVHADQLALTRELGDWIRRCFGPAAYLSNKTGTSVSIELDFPTPVLVDRVILQEDQSQGARVLAYDIQLHPPGGYTRQLISGGAGQAVGNKRIHFFPNGPIPLLSLIVTATQIAPGFTDVAWKNVAALGPCV